MAETKWTKGPWILSLSHDARPHGIYVAGYGSNIVEIYHYGYEDRSRGAEQTANANLIAAAPDLYQALSEYAAEEERKGWLSNPLDRANAALRKARGEA